MKGVGEKLESYFGTLTIFSNRSLVDLCFETTITILLSIVLYKTTHNKSKTLWLLLLACLPISLLWGWSIKNKENVCQNVIFVCVQYY